MRVFLAALALTLATYGPPTTGQTTSGTSATIVVPVVAQTTSFSSEVTVYNPNVDAITLQITLYDAQNTSSPGLKNCDALPVPAGRSAQFAVATQCALPVGSNFGLLVLKEPYGKYHFYGYARTQTPQGVGFSTEGFPIENFNDQLQHATGLKRVAASAGLPAFQTNCFVATLGDAVNYELRLFDGTTNAPLGGTLSGSLAAFQQYRYLDVFAAAGVGGGDRTNVRAEFRNLTGANKKLIGFCTVQDNTVFSADFRIAKSYGGIPQNAFVQGGNAFGTTAILGTVDAQPLDINVNGGRVMHYDGPIDAPNVVGGYAGNSTFNVGVTIAGGGLNASSCSQSGVIGSSCSNNANADWATIGGGLGNLVGGSSGTVSGGDSNVVVGAVAAVGGGSVNSAWGLASVVSGGQYNKAMATHASVSGGVGNLAVGEGSIVPGGSANTASGDFSFAAGTRAKATARGAFAWADAQPFDHQVFVENAFGVRATGGVGFTVGIDANGAATWYCMLSNGVAGWQCTSDRNVKENLVMVDGGDVLRRLAAMPVFRWNAKGGDPEDRHLGPMAQDFAQAFGLGRDDKVIATGDLNGVALAAIQGLHHMVQERAARIAALEQQVAKLQSLRDEFALLKATVAELASGRAKMARSNASD